MSLRWDLITAYTILLPALAGILSGKWRDSVFKPLIICLWLGAINETSIYFLRSLGSYPLYIVIANFYYLFEAVLYMLFFYRVGVIKQKKYYQFWQIMVLTLFIVNATFRSPFHHGETHAFIFFSTIFGIFAIKLLTEQALNIRTSVLKNSLFFIGTGFLFLNTFSIFVDLLVLTQNSVYWLNAAISRWVFVVTYFLFTYAFLCNRKIKHIIN